MKLPDLWAAAEQCIVAFDSVPPNACITEDEHVRDYLKLHQKSMTAEEATFIQEVTYGVLRHRAFLDATLRGYCDARKKNKANAVSIQMLYYLIFYRFDEMGPHSIRQLIYKTLSSNRIAEMLELLLDVDALRAYVVPQWTTVVDDLYVERHVMGTLDRIAAPLGDLAAFFRQKASGTATVDGQSTVSGTKGARQPAKSPTDEIDPPPAPQSPKFKLFGFQKRDAEAEAGADTSRRQKRVQLPPYEVRLLDGLGERETFPKIADTCTNAEKRCIALTKKGVRGASTLEPSVMEQNRAAERAIPFKAFSGTSRPVQLPKLLAEAQRREEEEMRPVTTGADPATVGERLRRIRDEVEIKLTRTALKREHQLYQSRLQAEEQARLRKQQEMRDDSEFVAWKQRMEEAEEQERLEMVKQRKAELVAGDAAARDAKRKREAANLHMTAVEKTAMNEWRREVQERNERQQQELASQAQQLKVQLKRGAEHAVDSVAVQRKTAAAEVKDESRRIEQRVALQLELEKQRRQELIEEIKSAHAAFVEMQHKQRATMAERVANSALNGQLMSMSINELREKLVETKAEQAAWEEQQRDTISQKKRAAAAELESHAEFVERQRRQLREEREAQRQAKAAALDAKAEEKRKREENLALELQARLDEQRAAKKAEKDDRLRKERERRVAAQLLSADAGAMESLKWKEMERGRSNAVLAAQNENLKERKKHAAIEATVSRVRQENIAAVETQIRESRAAKDEAFRTKRTIASAEQLLDDDIRTAATKRMRDNARTLRMTALTGAM